MLPHDQQPGRVYREVAQLGRELETLGEAVVGLTPDAQVGMVWSARSKWGLACQSPFTTTGSAFASSPGEADQRAYARIFGAFYEGAFEAGVGVRILHDDQILGPDGEMDPAGVAAELPVLVVAGLFVADDALLTWLRRYAEAGGHLVLGMRTAYADEEGRARREVKPALLAEAAGVSYQEIANVDELAITARTDGFTLSPESRATAWVDGLISQGHGAGRVPAPALRAVPRRGHHRARRGSDHHGRHAAEPLAGPGPGVLAGPGRPRPLGTLPGSVTVSSATAADGSRLHVVHNWSWTPQVVRPDLVLRDLLGAPEPVGPEIALGPWDVRVLTEVGQA